MQSTDALGARLDADAAALRLEQGCGSSIDRADERIAAILEFADGVPLAVDAAARAIKAVGVEATWRALGRTILGEGELRRALEAMAQGVSPEARALVALLAVWEGPVAPLHIVDAPQFSVAAIEELTAAGCLVSEGKPEPEIRLVRPLVVLAREGGLSPSAVDAHATLVGRLAGELLTQLEMTGDLEPLLRARADLTVLVRRALSDPALLGRAFVAVRALAPIACFERADDELIGVMRELLHSVEAPERAAVGFGHAALALALAERARGRAAAAAELVDAALSIAMASSDRALEGRAARVHGAMLVDVGRLREATSELERAVEASEEGGDDVHRTLALQWLALALGCSGELERAIASLRETIELHQALGNIRMLLYEQSMLGSFYAQSGDVRRGRIAIEEAVRLARHLGDGSAEAFARASLAYTVIAEGDLHRAVTEAAHAERLFVGAEQPALVAYCRGVEGIARLLMGETDRALSLLEHAGAYTKEIERPLFVAYLATIEARDGLADQARARIALAERAIAGAPGSIEPAVAVLAAGVRRLLDPTTEAAPHEGRSVDVRIAQLWLEALALPVSRAPSQPAPSALLIRRDGSAFSRQGAVTRIGAKPVMKRLVEALARHRVAEPGEALAITTLADLVWPGERMLEKSARTRLHAAVLRLRQLGLRGALIQSDGGYRFDPIETDVVDTL